MALNTSKQTKLSTLKGKPRTGYQEQVFSEQLAIRFPATLQSAGQSMGYVGVQAYFATPKPESPAAPVVVSQNLVTQDNNFITTETGDPLITQ